MNKGNKIVIVLPAYDPDAVMLEFVDVLKNHLSEQLSLLVVNDGSAAEKKPIFDQLAELKFSTVLHHEVNRGKGAALKTAFSFLLEKYADDPDFIGCVTADCDGQHSVEDILRAVEELKIHPENLILGCRTFQQDDVPWKSRFGNECTKFIFRKLLHQPVSDTQTGLRGLPTRLMERCLLIKGNRFELETEMLLVTNQVNCPIHEYPIQTIYFDANSGTHFHPVKDALRIYGIILGFLLGRFCKFVITGLSSALLDVLIWMLIFNFLERYDRTLSIFNHPFHLSILLATVTARICSSLYNFTLNRKFVFRDGRRQHNRIAADAVKYYILAVCLLTASYLLTDICSHWVPNAFMPIAKAAVDLFLFGMSYFAQRHIVFR